MTKKTSVPVVISDIGEKIGGARKDVAVKVGPRPKLSDPADTRPGWAKRFVAAENIGYDKKPTGKWGLLDTRRESKWGGYRAASRMEFESQAAAEKAIPLIAVSQKHYVRESYAKGADGKYDSSKSTFEIWRKVSDKKTVKAVAESFTSREAALAHMASQAETLLGTAKGYGEEILAKPERVVRKGPDWRKGDVHPEAFVKEIGARGVEFGNWQGERQTIVNHAYDAMRDLADITGVKPESLTLGNKLAIAFGARGNGGKRSARAHYEPKRAAINLTKESGAGTLAHEWWHAADHYLAQVDEPKLGEMTIDKDGTKVLPHANDDMRIFGSHRVAGGIKPGALSEPVKQAYKDLMDTMFNKPMEVTVDKPVYDAKLARAKESLKTEIDRLRGEIAKPAPYGKRNVAAATPEQLAKFDKVAERILASTPADLETKYTYNNTDIALGSRGSMAGRWSNATLDELSGVYKEVRGRSGFDSQHGRGVMDTVRHRMSEVKTAMALAEDAAKSATRTIMGRTDFAKNAVKLDQSRTTPYWQTRHEMAARAFTAFIEDKLAAAGRKSDYLSYGSDNVLYKVFDEALPFPEGAERQAINAKFEALFDAMKQAEVVKASAPSPANMLSAMTKGSAEGQQTMVTGQSGKPNPGWSDAARAKSAEVRAANAADMGKPMSAAMQRALETSQAKATATPSTLAKPAPVAPAPTEAQARAVSRQEFMAQAEVRPHPEGGHEVRGPGTNGQWVRTNATGTPTAAKMVAFANHVGKAANKLGAIAMIAAPVTAAALAYDATRSQAAADGLSPTQQTTHALGSAAAAGLTTAGVGYGIMKGIGLLAKAAPKIVGRALPGIGLGLMAYGAYEGAKRHGWKGAVLGTVGADGLLDLGADQVPQIRAALPAPTSMPDAAQKFEVANDAFNAMQESAASERILRGFQNPNNLAAALAAQGKELGRPAHGKP